MVPNLGVAFLAAKDTKTAEKVEEMQKRAGLIQSRSMPDWILAGFCTEVCGAHEDVFRNPGGHGRRVRASLWASPEVADGAAMLF